MKAARLVGRQRKHTKWNEASLNRRVSSKVTVYVKQVS